MSKNKKNTTPTIRSSAAEYLTFVAATGDTENSYEMRYENENIWLTQKMMAQIYDVSVQNIGQHIKKIFDDSELEREATIKKFFIVQTEGEREVSRGIDHYNLQMIIAVGFKVNNERAVQFRKWANKIVKDYTIQGWVMDVERLKNSGSVLTKEYFERQLELIREIRMSERKFYQKVTDLYSTALDYDKTAAATKRFFAAVQNKMHYAIHGNTAAEVIVKRADADSPHMGLTTWQHAPSGKILKGDVVIAKNYLTEFELGQMERMVSAYIDFGESMAMRNIPMTMADWETRLNRFIEMFEYGLLKDAGKVSAEIAKLHALTEFEKYRIIQDKLFQSDFDRFVELENAISESGRDAKDASLLDHETEVGE
ncbi:MAG: virulence RhuM family protein [Defluviitaleaceae bacterium]|nr:virulence RhuM family protein [Defluviitaleaceae bacterium]